MKAVMLKLVASVKPFDVSIAAIVKIKNGDIS